MRFLLVFFHFLLFCLLPTMRAPFSSCFPPFCLLRKVRQPSYLVFSFPAHEEQCRYQQVWGLARRPGDGGLHTTEAWLILAVVAIGNHPHLIVLILWHFITSYWLQVRPTIGRAFYLPSERILFKSTRRLLGAEEILLFVNQNRHPHQHYLADVPTRKERIHLWLSTFYQLFPPFLGPKTSVQDCCIVLFLITSLPMFF